MGNHNTKKQLNVYIHSDTHRALRFRAVQEETRMSDIAQKALSAYLATEPKKGGK